LPRSVLVGVMVTSRPSALFATKASTRRRYSSSVALWIEFLVGELLDEAHGEPQLGVFELCRLILVDLSEVADLIVEMHRMKH
jgi:hypothetical protein